MPFVWSLKNDGGEKMSLLRLFACLKIVTEKRAKRGGAALGGLKARKTIKMAVDLWITGAGPWKSPWTDKLTTAFSTGLL